MDDFIPTTDQVRDAYTYDERYEYEHPDDPGYVHVNRARFDRWLAAHDAGVFVQGLTAARDAAFKPYPGLGWESSVEKIDALIADVTA